MITLFNQFRTSNQFERTIFIVLPLMHFAGLLGLQFSATQPFFKALVPFHLITSLILLLIFHTDWSRPFIAFCGITYLIGFLVEALGVHTGLIFGEYNYGQTLGWKVIDIPAVIGINWLSLIYAVGVMVNDWHHSKIIKTFLAALIVVGLDILIEPVAIHFDFWSWATIKIPLQNYVAWYIISFGLLWLFYQLSFSKKNRLAVLFLGCQALFFVFHNLVFLLQ
ncbi:MAG: carotenoid biosynthesis protein [Spirosomataceae bacterium]